MLKNLKSFAVEESIDGRTLSDVGITQKSDGQGRRRLLRDHHSKSCQRFRRRQNFRRIEVEFGRRIALVLIGHGREEDCVGVAVAEMVGPHLALMLV